MTNFCHDFPSLQVAKHDEIEKKKTGGTTYVHAFKKKGHYDYPGGLYFSMKRNYGKIGYKILLKYGAMTVVYNVRRLNHCYCMSRWVFCDPVFSQVSVQIIRPFFFNEILAEVKQKEKKYIQYVKNFMQIFGRHDDKKQRFSTEKKKKDRERRVSQLVPRSSWDLKRTAQYIVIWF